MRCRPTRLPEGRGQKTTPPPAGGCKQANSFYPCSILFWRTYAIHVAEDSAKAGQVEARSRCQRAEVAPICKNARSKRASCAMAGETEVAYLSAVELIELFRSKALSPVEVIRLALDRLDELQPKINAFCVVDRDGAT